MLNVCSLVILSICNFGCFPFWFLWQDCVSDTLVPDHCLPFTLLSCRESHCILRTSVCEFVMFHIHLNKQNHIWVLLKRRERHLRYHRTQALLEHSVNQVWRQITPAIIQNYIWDMRQRCKVITDEILE